MAIEHFGDACIPQSPFYLRGMETWAIKA